MKRKPNPLRGTVDRFLSQQMQRRLRQIRQAEKLGHEIPPWPKRPGHKESGELCQKKPKESAFVKFMNGLAKRGPDRPFNLYDKWSVAIRKRMSARGTWPAGMQDWNLDILAEYLQEAQREFWNHLPEFKKAYLREYSFKYAEHIGLDIERMLLGQRRPGTGLSAHFDKVSRYFEKKDQAMSTLRVIHEMLRSKGLRDKRYIMARWDPKRCITRIYLNSYPESEPEKSMIWFETAQWMILHCWTKFRDPLLIMPHKVWRADISGRNVHQRQRLQPDEEFGF